MRPEEIVAVGDLAGDAAGGLTARVRETHEAIAGRTFHAIGPAAVPVAMIHDGIAGAVYATVGAITRLGLRAGARAIGAVAPGDARALGERSGERRALAALNGAFGDLLHERHSPLELTMSLRHDGRDLVPAAEALANAYPGASPRLALFVHGLGQTEDAWRRGTVRAPLYGTRLQAELDYTPLYVRYNSGRPIRENGLDLARLIERTVAAWPVPVRQLALVGHAAGALVLRSACDHGAEREWVGQVRHVITLGAPHRGAAAEKLVRAAGRALTRVPETRPVSRALELRSAGLQDAGQGSVVPFLPGARYLFVSASISRDPHLGLGRVLGDFLVSRDSAWAHPGGGERMRFPPESYRQIGGINHFELPRHPVVLEQIASWLAAPELPAPRAQLPSAPQRP
jgi:hypothetical protein